MMLRFRLSDVPLPELVATVPFPLVIVPVVIIAGYTDLLVGCESDPFGRTAITGPLPLLSSLPMAVEFKLLPRNCVLLLLIGGSLSRDSFSVDCIERFVGTSRSCELLLDKAGSRRLLALSVPRFIIEVALVIERLSGFVCT